MGKHQAETLPAQFRTSVGVCFRMAFTDTHILSIYDHHERGLCDCAALIQFFGIPSDGSLNEEGIPALYLTHEGFSEHRLLDVIITKHDIDPVTGVTSMKLLAHRFWAATVTITRINLVLPKPRSHEVSPIFPDMTINSIQILPGVEASRYPHSARYLDVSDETRLWGFWRGRPRRKFADRIENQHIVKFAVDMRKEPWAVTFSRVAPAEWQDAPDPGVDTPKSSIIFDGSRGRLSYIYSSQEIVVMDIE